MDYICTTLDRKNLGNWSKLELDYLIDLSECSSE